MIVNAQIRPYRCQAKTMGRHQRVAVTHGSEMSVELRRAVIIALCAALFMVVACGQVLHWQIMKGALAVEQLQTVSSNLNENNIKLLTKRALLMSPEHVEAVAAVRFDLHVPGKGQVHRL